MQALSQRVYTRFSHVCAHGMRLDANGGKALCAKMLRERSIVYPLYMYTERRQTTCEVTDPVACGVRELCVSCVYAYL